MNIFNTKLFVYCTGMLIGAITTLCICNISFNASMDETYGEYKQVVSENIKNEDFYQSNKDYIIAGLLLNEGFKDKLMIKLEEKNSKEKFEKYYNREIKSIYRSNISKYLSSMNKKDFLLKIKPILTKFKSKMINIIKTNIQKLIDIFKIKKDAMINFLKDIVKNELPNLSKKLRKKVVKFIEKNKDNLFIAINNLKKEVKLKIVAYISENIGEIFNIIKEYLVANQTIIMNYIITLYHENQELIKNIISSVIVNIYQVNKEEIIRVLKNIIINELPNISEKIKEKIVAFILENKDHLIDAILSLSEEVKQKIINYLLENSEIIIKIVMNYIVESTDEIYEFIIRIVKNSEIYGKIKLLFSNTDEDYNFTTININGNEIDISFLNILDIEIVDAVYNNNSTPLNLKDDILSISKIYINFESLDSKGIDIMTGHIDIKGIKAKLIYNLIGEINAFI